MYEQSSTYTGDVEASASGSASTSASFNVAAGGVGNQVEDSSISDYPANRSSLARVFTKKLSNSIVQDDAGDDLADEFTELTIAGE